MSKYFAKIKTRPGVLTFGFCVAAAVILRLMCGGFAVGSLSGRISQLMDFFRENGYWSALKEPLNGCGPAYQYILVGISAMKINNLALVKLVSVFFDFVLAAGCARCLRDVGADPVRQGVCFGAALLVPTVLLNGSLWGQCDSIWAALTVWSVCCLTEGRSRASMALLATAFSFGPQTVFALPIFLGALLCGRLKLRHLAVFPAVFLAACVPAFLCGQSPADIAGLYLRPFGAAIPANSPSLPGLLSITGPSVPATVIFTAIAAVFALGAAVGARKMFPDGGRLMELCLLLSLGLPFLLPVADVRYFYAAPVFALLCVFIKGAGYLPVFILAELSNLMCYMHIFNLSNRYYGRLAAYLLSEPAAAVLMLCALVLCLTCIFTGLLPSGRRAVTAGAFAAGLAAAILCFAGKPAVTLNGKPVNWSSYAPIARDGDISVPLNEVAAAWGGSVSMEDGCILVTREDRTVRIYPGTDRARINHLTVRLTDTVQSAVPVNVSYRDIESLLGLDCRRDGDDLRFIEHK